MKNLLTRILSGSIYVVLVVLAIMTIRYTPVLFLVVFGLLTALCLWEVYKVTQEGDVMSPLFTIIDILGGVGVFLAFFLMYSGTADTASGSRSFWMLPIIIYLLVRVPLQLYSPITHAVHSLERSFYGIAFVAVPMGMANSIGAVGSPMMLLAIFILLWVNDSGAYLVGSAIGKHKLFERISPHKSWEGFWGGAIASIVVAAVLGSYMGQYFPMSSNDIPLPLWGWIGMGLIVPIFGTLGDLSESLLKRTVGVKDTSHIIPGHGGFLDRLDSFLMACPATLVYFILLKTYF